jgi:putative membrane protein
LFGGAALAADTPSTIEVLGKLHDADQGEITMGKLAEKDGESKEVRDFGKMLVKDHTDADKKVAVLANEEKIELGKPRPMDMAGPASGPTFDVKFAQLMVYADQRDIAALTKARDSSTDDKLKKLLTELLLTLQKHEDTAQKILDGQGNKPHA